MTKMASELKVGDVVKVDDYELKIFRIENTKKKLIIDYSLNGHPVGYEVVRPKEIFELA